MTTQIQPLNQNTLPNEPTLSDVLDLFRKNLLIDLYCHHIGTIQSFDPVHQVGSATVNYPKTKFVLDDSTGLYAPQLISYPPISKAPVICLGGGNTSLTFPIAKGDECAILFNDRNLDNWFAGQTGGQIATARLHSFADSIILVGIRSSASYLKIYDTVRAVLQNGTTMVGVGPALIKIANAGTSLQQVLAGVAGITSSLSAIVTAMGTIGLSAPAQAILNLQITEINALIGSLLE